MWPDLPKGFLYMHSFKTHLLLPFDSYINGPTAHVFNAAEGWTVYFHSGLFLKHTCLMSMNARVAFEWPIFPWQADIQLWFTTQVVDEFGNGFSCIVWHVEVKIAIMDASWLVLLKTYPLPAASWLPICPLPSHPVGVLAVLATPVKNYLKWWAIQLAIQCIYSRHSELPWIAIDLWRNMCMQL